MYRFIVFTSLFLVNPLFANESITYKRNLISASHSFPFSYGLMLMGLFGALIILARYMKRTENSNPKCHVIEKITIHHKTKVYVIDYQGQHFLIADNQNSLAIHPL